MPEFFGGGIRRLSDLIIDVSKDWQGYRILNLGTPTEPDDATSKGYVDLATTGLGINYYLYDEADVDVPAYKKMSITPPNLTEAYVEIEEDSVGDYLIQEWIAEPDGISVVKLGVYTINFQSEIVGGGAKIRFFFRLYERQSGGTEILIVESTPSNRIKKERENVVTSAVLTSDYVMATGSRLVLKLYARWEENRSATVRIYYQGAANSRLAVPTVKEILDTVYAAKVHTHSPSDISPQGSGSGLDADTLDGLHASDILAQAGRKALVAADEAEVSTTSTSNTSLKQFNLVKLADAGNDWKTMTVIAEGYIDTSGQTAYLDIYVGGSKMATITWTETSYTLKYAQIDISSLADGKYLVDFQMRVTGGTGYFGLLEVWVE
ncbi:MAG: hypothetical protein ACXQS2_00345 [Methermicoccaceae archaeon]